MRETIVTLRKKVLTLAVSGHFSTEYPFAKWKQYSLKSLPGAIAFFDGDWVESKDQDENGAVRLTQLSDIGDGYWRNRSDRWLTSNRAQLLGCRYLLQGDILISRMADPIGRACIYPGYEYQSVTAVDVAVLRLDEQTTSNTFIIYCINSSATRAEIEKKATGTTRKRISGKKLGEILVSIPPLAEQRRIVAKVEEIMQTLDLLEQEANDVEAVLDLLEKRILTEAVSGKLVPQDPSEGTGEELYQAIQKARAEAAKTATGRKKNAKPLPPITPDEIPFEIPENWRWMRLGEVFNNRDSERRPVKKDNRVNGEYPYYGATGIQDWVNEFIFEGTKLLVGEDGAKWGSGESTGYIASGKFWVNNHCHVLESYVEPDTFCRFGAFLMTAYDLVDLGLVRGVTVKKLNQESLNSAPYPLPPLAEQRRIVAKVDEAMSLIKHLREAVK